MLLLSGNSFTGMSLWSNSTEECVAQCVALLVLPCGNTLTSMSFSRTSTEECTALVCRSVVTSLVFVLSFFSVCTEAYPCRTKKRYSHTHTRRSRTRVQTVFHVQVIRCCFVSVFGTVSRENVLRYESKSLNLHEKPFSGTPWRLYNELARSEANDYFLRRRLTIY